MGPPAQGLSPVPTHVSSIPTGREELHRKPPPSWEGPGWQEGLLCPVDTCSSLPSRAGTGSVPGGFYRTAHSQVPGLSSVSDAIRCRLAILQSWVRLLRAETRGRSGMMVRRMTADTGIPKRGCVAASHRGGRREGAQGAISATRLAFA